MKIIGMAVNPSTSIPTSALTEGENGPLMRVAARAPSQSSAVFISAATTSMSLIASMAPNCAGEAPTGTMPSL